MQLNKGLIKKLSDTLQNYIIECNNAENMKEKWRIDVQLNRKKYLHHPLPFDVIVGAVAADFVLHSSLLATYLMQLMELIYYYLCYNYYYLYYYFCCCYYCTWTMVVVVVEYWQNYYHPINSLYLAMLMCCYLHSIYYFWINIKAFDDIDVKENKSCNVSKLNMVSRWA